MLGLRQMRQLKTVIEIMLHECRTFNKPLIQHNFQSFRLIMRTLFVILFCAALPSARRIFADVIFTRSDALMMTREDRNKSKRDIKKHERRETDWRRFWVTPIAQITSKCYRCNLIHTSNTFSSRCCLIIVPKEITDGRASTRKWCTFQCRVQYSLPNWNKDRLNWLGAFNCIFLFLFNSINLFCEFHICLIRIDSEWPQIKVKFLYNVWFWIAHFG